MNEPIENGVDFLADRIETLVASARRRIVRAVNSAQVYTYFEIGRYIVEVEQGGKSRAAYGKGILKKVSERLTERLGKGWSEENLRQMKKFFLLYSDETSIRNRKKINLQTRGFEIDEAKIRDSVTEIEKTNFQTTGLEIQNKEIQDNVLEIEEANLYTTGTQIQDSVTSGNQIQYFPLSWIHYQILCRVEDPNARSFYEIETLKQQWSKRQLMRQIASSLYERLALSRNKEEILRLATEGQVIEKPTDILKDPLVLDFIGLKADVAYSENRLESAIISRLQEFLLEMGKGFLFEARQKRFSFEERHFYVDLVLYNRLLQCYVLIDLKLGDLVHQDLGQMQMYVNYYDRYVREAFEKPTIGILLCQTKNEALVELTLPKEANIYAQQYAVCLPDKALLQQKLREWIEEFKDLKELQ